jgi:hypothetical protein
MKKEDPVLSHKSEVKLKMSAVEARAMVFTGQPGIPQ